MVLARLVAGEALVALGGSPTRAVPGSGPVGATARRSARMSAAGPPTPGTPGQAPRGDDIVHARQIELCCSTRVQPASKRVTTFSQAIPHPPSDLDSLSAGTGGPSERPALPS